MDDESDYGEESGAMDQSRFYGLIGRAIMEPGFRDQLTDPDRQADALLQVGIEPTDDVLEHLNESIQAIKDLASSEMFGDTAAVT
jgi:hypothetical protein